MMKKMILALLLCASLLGSVAGCASREIGSFGTEQENFTTDAKDAQAQQIDQALLHALTEYLKTIYTEHDMETLSLADKIDIMKKEESSLLVSFEESYSYYMCGYYHGTHEHEAIEYCCVDNYAWVKYDQADEVSEYYNGEPCVVVFQINKASLVKNVSSDEKYAPGVEHFQMYIPQFRGGKNINPNIAYNSIFIYLGQPDGSTVYCSESRYDYDNLTLPCIHLENLYYIPAELYTDYPTGERAQGNVSALFGEYYNDLTAIMITDKYCVMDDKGATTQFGLIEIEALLDKIVR